MGGRTMKKCMRIMKTAIPKKKCMRFWDLRIKRFVSLQNKLFQLTWKRTNCADEHIEVIRDRTKLQ